MFRVQAWNTLGHTHMQRSPQLMLETGNTEQSLPQSVQFITNIKLTVYFIGHEMYVLVCLFVNK